MFGVSLSSAADKACCRPAASTKWYTHFTPTLKKRTSWKSVDRRIIIIIIIIALTKNVLLCARSSFWSRQAGGTVKLGYDVDCWIMRGRNKSIVMTNIEFGRRQHDDVMKRVSFGSLY